MCWDLCGQFGIGDTGEVALHGTDGSVSGSVQSGHMYVAAQVGDEHAVVRGVERDADAFHQVGQDDFGFAAFDVVQQSPIDGVAVRRVATVSPVQHPRGDIDFEVDRLV